MADIAQEIRGTLKTYCHRSTDDEIERAVQVLEHAFASRDQSAYNVGVEAAKDAVLARGCVCDEIDDFEISIEEVIDLCVADIDSLKNPYDNT